LIRVGNAEYAQTNKSYGLTTMRRKHVEIGRGVLRFEFTGKSGKQWKLQVEDNCRHREAMLCAEIPGHELQIRRWNVAHGGFRRCELVHQGSHATGFQRQGLSNLGGHGARGPRAGGVQEV